MPIATVALLVLSLGLSPNHAHDYWTTVGDMPAPATGQMVALLHGGRVLAVGGEAVTDGFPVATTQIYNPRSGSWSYGPSMHTGRIGATATTLADGWVLVVGGLGPKLGALRSAEIFNPSTSTWSATTPLPQTRFSHSATLLSDGNVLVVGGIVSGRSSHSALLFNPSTQHWSSAPPSQYSHAQQAAVAITGGRILLAGGYGNPETYDPAHNSWMPVSTIAFRLHPVVVKLANGSILMATGRDTHDHDLRSARLYNPVSGVWSKVGSLHTRRSQAVGALLPNGTVLIAGGEQISVHVLNSAEVYDPVSRSWQAAAPMHTPRDAAIAIPLPAGTVMVCGGMNLSGVLSSCEVYHP